MSDSNWITDLTAEFPELRSQGAAPALILSRLVERLIECLQSNQTGSFDRLFERVEHHLIYGDLDARNALLVNFLEQLKNVAASRDVDFAAFESWLQPETIVAWRWLEKRWQGKRSLADEVRTSSAESTEVTEFKNKNPL